jgi:hypothetical protein
MKEAAEPVAAPVSGSVSIAINDLAAVKELVNRLGKDSLAELVEVL